MATKEDVIGVAKSCYDPEIPVNIYDLGLVYKIDVPFPNTVSIEMTLTSQHCPSAASIPQQLEARVREELGVEHVNVNVVWDPPWTPQMISPEGRKMLHLDPEAGSE